MRSFNVISLYLLNLLINFYIFINNSWNIFYFYLILIHYCSIFVLFYFNLNLFIYFKIC